MLSWDDYHKEEDRRCTEGEMLRWHFQGVAVVLGQLENLVEQYGESTAGGDKVDLCVLKIDSIAEQFDLFPLWDDFGIDAKSLV